MCGNLKFILSVDQDISQVSEQVGYPVQHHVGMVDIPKIPVLNHILVWQYVLRLIYTIRLSYTIVKFAYLIYCACANAVFQHLPSKCKQELCCIQTITYAR